ncbi:MAG: hypothetical protein AB7L09_14935 [Nitrospira sp.]
MRESLSFHTKRKHNGDHPTIQTTGKQLRYRNIKATIWQNVSENGPFFSTTFSRPFKDQSGAWRNGTSSGLNGLGVFVTIIPCQIMRSKTA